MVVETMMREKISCKEAVRRLAFSAAGMDHIIIVVCVPVVMNLLGIHDSQQIGDGDMLGASSHTITAGGTGDQIHRMVNLPHLVNGRQLFYIQRAEILHKADVLLHLFDAAHAGEYHQHALKPGGIADCITCGRAAAQLIQHSLCLWRQIDQIAALYRLHDNDRLAEFAADLIAFPALHGRIFIVQVVKLDLYHFHLRVLGQNLFQHLRTVMEGDAKMPDFTLRLQFQRRLIGTALFEVSEVVRALGVHQIEVEIVDTAGVQLALKQRPDILLLFLPWIIISSATRQKNSNSSTNPV